MNIQTWKVLAGIGKLCTIQCTVSAFRFQVYDCKYISNYFLFNKARITLFRISKSPLLQEEYIEEVTRLSQCLNAKTGFVYF